MAYVKAVIVISGGKNEESDKVIHAAIRAAQTKSRNTKVVVTATYAITD